MIQSKGIFEFNIDDTEKQKCLKIYNQESVTWNNLLNFVNRSAPSLEVNNDGDYVTPFPFINDARLKVYGKDSDHIDFHFYVSVESVFVSTWEGVEETDNLDDKKGAIKFIQNTDPERKLLSEYNTFYYNSFLVDDGDDWYGTDNEDDKGNKPEDGETWDIGDTVFLEASYTLPSSESTTFDIIGLEMQFKLTSTDGFDIADDDDYEKNDGSDWIRGPYSHGDVAPIEGEKLDVNDTFGDFSYTSVVEGYEGKTLSSRITGFLARDSFISDRSDNKIYHPRVIVFSNTANATEIFKYDSGTGALVMIDNALVILEKGSDFYENTDDLSYNSGISITDSDNITRVFNTIYNSIDTNNSTMWENGDNKVHVKDTGEINIEKDLMQASVDANDYWHVWFKFHINGTATDRQAVRVGMINMTDIIATWKPKDRLGWEFTW